MTNGAQASSHEKPGTLNEISSPNTTSNQTDNLPATPKETDSIKTNGNLTTNGSSTNATENDIVNQGVSMFCGTKRIRETLQYEGSKMSKQSAKSKKQKMNDDHLDLTKSNKGDSSSDTSTSQPNITKFDWEQEIRTMLAKNVENGLKIKTIKKKLLKR